MNEDELRYNCLMLAIQAQAIKPVQIAGEFYDFVRNKRTENNDGMAADRKRAEGRNVDTHPRP